jgi:hypothetical protein
MKQMKHIPWQLIKEQEWSLREGSIGVVCLLEDAYFRSVNLEALTAQAAGQVQIAGHDGDALGVDGAQVGVG